MATLLVYAQTFDFEFVRYDDYDHLAHIPEHPGLADLVWTLDGGDWPLWHPLTWASYMLDARLFGKADAGAFHRTNVVLHLVATLALFLALRRMTDQDAPSAFVAGVFALHPLHVESVAWVSERKDVLSGAFWMLSMWGYASFVRSGSRLAYGLALAAFGLGMMAKPLVVTLPFALLLLDHWPLRRRWSGRLIAEKLPYFALAALIAAWTFALQRRGGAVVSLELLGAGDRLSNAVVSYALYLARSFWPAEPFALALFYPHPFHPWVPAPSAWQVFGALSLLAAISVGSAWAARRGEAWLLVGWLWFLGTLVPMIGLVQVGSAAMADRYAYVPQVGLALAVAWAGASLTERRPALRPLVTALGVLLLLLLAGLGHRQAAYWKDGPTVFARTLEVTHGLNPLIEYNLGREYEMRGEFDGALRSYARARQVDPSDPDPPMAMARLLLERGERSRAAELYRAVLRRQPRHAFAMYSLARTVALDGELDETERLLERVIELEPADWLQGDARRNLEALRLQRRGRPATN